MITLEKSQAIPRRAVSRDRNVISVDGNFETYEMYGLLSELHAAVERCAYKDITLNFRNCTSAFARPMLGICAHAVKLRENNVDLKLILPNKGDLNKLFQNANWANLIDPKHHNPAPHSQRHLPASWFKNSAEQHSVVNQVVETIVGSITDITREDLAALEWSISEITDNVLTHSQAECGGGIQVTIFRENSKRIEFVVADAGVGIPCTLRETHLDIRSDTEALDRAIREGVTRDASVGQGNGLFGSYEICNLSKGAFSLNSGCAELSYKDSTGLHTKTNKIPFVGTLVSGSIDYSIPHLLENALCFNGKKHNPLSMLDMKYGECGEEYMPFLLKEEAMSFGTRPAGTPVKNKISMLLKSYPCKKVRIDFEGVPIVSSSFADEAFAKLFVEIGAMHFMKVIDFVNLTPTISSIIDHAIMKRNASSIVSA